jgi:putative Mg2+ transporter-C (MgtC) family protein
MAASDQWIILLQIPVAAILGGAVGLERELGVQTAGLRTHMLVSMGAALFTLSGTFVGGSDPTRIAAQVVTGIGFLGGGAILREGLNIRGLTTAASLWVAAAIGLAVGLKWWYAAAATTALTVAILWLIKSVEREALPRRRLVEVALTLEPDAHMDRVEREACSILPWARVLRVSYSATEQHLVLTGQTEHSMSLSVIGERLCALSGVHGVDVKS